MGLDKISVTLYDLLGYLLPGYVLLLACSLAEASYWERSSLFSVSSIGHNPFLATIAAYFLGQASHAAASWIKAKRYRWFDDRGSYRLSPEVAERVYHVIQETYGIKPEGDKRLPKIDRYLLADSYIVASGGSVERDILTAREGFFKASSLAFAILALTVLSMLFAPHGRIQVRPEVFIYPTTLSVVGLTAFLLLFVWLFRQRFIFFSCVKNNNALLTFLALRQKGGKGEAANNPGGE